MTTAAPGAPSASPPLSAYQRRRFALLGVAAFFEGSDFALTHMLPHLRKDFALDYGSTGILFGVVNFGTMLAHLRARS